MSGKSLAIDGHARLASLLDDLLARGVVTALTADRVSEIWLRFVVYLGAGWGIEDLADVTVDAVQGFVTAPFSRDRELLDPSVPTMHVRRCAVRLLFRALRDSGDLVGDPTRDVVLPARSSSPGRPLSDDEVGLCRAVSLSTLSETRLPAAWALAEATARTAELAEIRVRDLDFDAGRVWIHGASKTEPRWGELDAWGVHQVQRRVDTIGRSPDARLVYQGGGSSGPRHAASCNAINAVLTRASLAHEPDVRPVSVAAWAGARVLATTGRIEAAAHALGMRSLDRAARLIGWSWVQATAEPVT